MCKKLSSLGWLYRYTHSNEISNNYLCTWTYLNYSFSVFARFDFVSFYKRKRLTSIGRIKVVILPLFSRWAGTRGVRSRSRQRRFWTGWTATSAWRQTTATSPSWSPSYLPCTTWTSKVRHRPPRHLIHGRQRYVTVLSAVYYMVVKGTSPPSQSCTTWTSKVRHRPPSHVLHGRQRYVTVLSVMYYIDIKGSSPTCLPCTTLTSKVCHHPTCHLLHGRQRYVTALPAMYYMDVKGMSPSCLPCTTWTSKVRHRPACLVLHGRQRYVTSLPAMYYIDVKGTSPSFPPCTTWTSKVRHRPAWHILHGRQRYVTILPAIYYMDVKGTSPPSQPCTTWTSKVRHRPACLVLHGRQRYVTVLPALYYMDVKGTSHPSQPCTTLTSKVRHRPACLVLHGRRRYVAVLPAMYYMDVKGTSPSCLPCTTWTSKVRHRLLHRTGVFNGRFYCSQFLTLIFKSSRIWVFSMYSVCANYFHHTTAKTCEIKNYWYLNCEFWNTKNLKYDKIFIYCALMFFYTFLLTTCHVFLPRCPCVVVDVRVSSVPRLWDPVLLHGADSNVLVSPAFMCCFVCINITCYFYIST